MERGMGTIEAALSFYRQVVSDRLSASVEGCSALGGRRACVFTSVVTVWLMIFQRLHPRGSLVDALSHLQQDYVAGLLEAGSSKARNKRISGNTGGYSRARHRLPLESVKKVCDEVNAALHECRSSSGAKEKNIFIIDGSILRLSHTESILESYPPKVNQYGDVHYPLLRLGVVTHALTGVVLRPAFGPHDGPEAVGEISLAGELFKRLPEHSTVIADRYYGTARIAHEAQALGHDVILRVKELVANRYIGVPQSSKGQVEVEWISTRSCTGKEYRVPGRFIWHTLKRKGYRPQKLVLFTTSSLPMNQIVEMYALRWNVELDLRALKSTLSMDMIHSKSPTMVAKEIILGFAAYNLVRHVAIAAARSLKISPREISFTTVLSRIEAAANSILSSPIPNAAADPLRGLLGHMQSLKLPKRRKQRQTEPRKVWPKGGTRIMTKSRHEERELLRNKNKLDVK